MSVIHVNIVNLLSDYLLGPNLVVSYAKLIYNIGGRTCRIAYEYCMFDSCI